jgi:phosphatidylserine decarboxylase
LSPYPHPIIAREGWPFLGIALVVSLLVTYFAGWWSAPFWLATLFGEKVYAAESVLARLSRHG